MNEHKRLNKHEQNAHSGMLQYKVIDPKLQVTLAKLRLEKGEKLKQLQEQ